MRLARSRRKPVPGSPSRRRRWRELDLDHSDMVGYWRRRAARFNPRRPAPRPCRTPASRPPAPRQDRRDRAQLPRPRARVRRRAADEAAGVRQVPLERDRPGRGHRHRPRGRRAGRLGGRAGRGHRPPAQQRRRRRRRSTHVFGYTVANDVSARDVQFADGQWMRGKSLDTFCPLGPVVVSADEIPDPQALRAADARQRRDGAGRLDGRDGLRRRRAARVLLAELHARARRRRC